MIKVGFLKGQNLSLIIPNKWEYENQWIVSVKLRLHKLVYNSSIEHVEINAVAHLNGLIVDSTNVDRPRGVPCQ